MDSILFLFYPITLGGRRGTTDEFATIPFHLDLFSAALVARLAGKYRWREFPAVITGNYRPGKYSSFWQSGKYWEI